MKTKPTCKCKRLPCREQKNEETGEIEFLICKLCHAEKVELKRIQTEFIASRSLIQKGVGKRHSLAKLSDFSKSVQKLTTPESYAILGDVGSGKTHLAVALMRESILKGAINIEFIPMIELLRKVRACFEADSTAKESEIINHYSKLDELYIDDIGADKPTDWVLSTIFSIIDYRYRNFLTTVITSNIGLAELVPVVGERVVSRIIEMCEVIKLEGKDKRLDGI